MMVTEAFARLLKRFPNVALFHIIFDSYMEKSLKSGEGAVRTAAAGGAITLARIRDDTKVPEQMDKFWASSENKVKFQSYVKSKFQALAREVTKSVILSGVVIDNTPQPATFLTEQGEVQSIFELNFDHEEADFRIIPHIGWDITTFSRKSVTVVSEDTDVLVLLLHYFNSFNTLGLQSLYMQLGKGDRRRMLSVNKMFDKFGNHFCKEILSVHIGTGCDQLSKIGMKKASLKADPTNLKDFGKTVILDDEQIKTAEQYLVNVSSSTKGKVSTFDELRVLTYKRTGSALNLPPTSASVINGHIKRWWYLLKINSILLNPNRDSVMHNPLDYGWEDQEGDWYAKKELDLIPDELCNTCKCKTGCKNKRCLCVKADGSKCTDFCLCIDCQNK